MQPHYTVDHETRHNSANRAEEESQAPVSLESSPLLPRFPQYERPMSPSTMIIVSFLLLIFVAGVIIGIYLLVIQNDSENILPPVESPLQLVTRTQWDQSNASQIMLTLLPHKSSEVMVVQTNTDQCWSTESCIILLHALQGNATGAKNIIPYNFLISSNGQTYEALGWHWSSPSWKQPSSGLVLALIGNFNKIPPSPLQIQEAKKFFTMAVSQQHLHPSYRIIRKNILESPTYLSKSFMGLPQWDSEFADGRNKQ